jgi:hypothetical protein
MSIFKLCFKADKYKQILFDINSAKEMHLTEATKFLSPPTKYNEKERERLKKMKDLGFSNISEIVEFNKFNNYESNKHIFKYYYNVYPNYKIINTDDFEKIYNKYCLLQCDAKDYIAHIPKENQIEIVEFKIKRKDLFCNLDKLNSVEIKSYGLNIKEYENEWLPGRNLFLIIPKRMATNSSNPKFSIVLQAVQYGYLIVSSWSDQL